RIDALSTEEKRVLQDASVVGEAVATTLLTRLSGRGTARALRGLRGKDLLRPVAGAGRYEFKHAVIRDVAYESLPRTDRAARHRLAAELLETGSEPHGERIAVLSHHYEQAWDLSRSRTGVAPDATVARRA